jgi:hypothetical protein
MNYRTIAVEFPASRNDVFSYLSKISNLPNWATEFCKELKTVEGKTKVVTCDPSVGELFFKIESDPKTGVIDMLAGPTEDHLMIYPARIIDAEHGGSVFLFTMFQANGMSDEKFEQQHESFLIEAENLKRIFGS